MTFRSDSLFLQVLLILSLNDSKFFLKWPTGIFSAVCIIVSSILMATTPAGAMSKTFGLSSNKFPYEKILVRDWYITFIKMTYHSLHHQLRGYAMTLPLLAEKMICFYHKISLSFEQCQIICVVHY